MKKILKYTNQQFLNYVFFFQALAKYRIIFHGKIDIAGEKKTMCSSLNHKKGRVPKGNRQKAKGIIKS